MTKFSRAGRPWAVLSAIAVLAVFPGVAGAKSVAQTPLMPGYLGRLAVGEPLAYEGLMVYPLTTSRDFDLSTYRTLDEALKAKALVVTELKGGAEVNTVLMENKGDRHVFIMAGEILRGAKQDRTVQADVLLPPKSGKREISAFCVEHGRWAENSKSFDASEQAVPNSVRRSAKNAKEQGQVWDSIEKNQSRLSVAAPSQAAKDIYEDKKVQADLKPLEQRLSALPKQSPGMVGVVATFGGRLIAMDVFGDDTLMAKLYPKLLRSYAVDVIGDKPEGKMSASQVQSLVTQASRAPWAPVKTEGVGQGLEFRLKGHHGTALTFKDMVIHSDQFEGVEPPPSSRRERDRTPDLNQRQQRR